MRLKDVIGQAWHAAQASPVPPTPNLTRATGPLPVPSAGRVVMSGVAAGATVVALSAASALTSRMRRRMEGS